MLDDSIKTFMEVVKYGSFAKAAKSLYLSPNAIKKRINVFEEQSGIILFDRSNKGVVLTKAGYSLYKDCLNIYEHYISAIEKANRIQQESNEIFTIGMMNTFSDTFTTNNWYEVRNKFSEYPVHIAYFGNKILDRNELLQCTRNNIDMAIDIYDNELAQTYNLNVIETSSFALYIGIPDSIATTFNSKIAVQDLRGYTISLLYKGRSKIFDEVHKLLRSENTITIEEIDEYSIRTFNDIYVKKNCVVVTENQINLYPYFSFYPLDTPKNVQFGIYYSEHNKEKIQHFIRKITPE